MVIMSSVNGVAAELNEGLEEMGPVDEAPMPQKPRYLLDPPMPPLFPSLLRMRGGLCREGSGGQEEDGPEEEALEEEYGSMDAYLREGLGLSDELLERVRDRLLE